MAAGDHGGQRWLEDDSWATYAMAGLALVSPLGVWGALAAAPALLQPTGAPGHPRQEPDAQVEEITMQIAKQICVFFSAVNNITLH